MNLHDDTRALMAWSVKHARVEYGRDGNPLHISDAYQTCRMYGLRQSKEGLNSSGYERFNLNRAPFD